MAYAFFRASHREAKAGASLVRYRGQLGVWYLGYKDEHGRSRQCKSAAATQAEAEKLATELERKAERVRLGVDAAVKEDMPLREGVALYLASLPPEYRSKAQLESRFRLRILPHLGELLCRAITPADVKRMLAANADTAAQTREHLRVAVAGCFSFLIRDLKLVTGENPAAALGKVAIPKSRPKFLQMEDVPRLLSAVPAHYRAVFTVAVGTGLRKGELLALRWDDLDLGRRCLHVGRSHDSHTTKGGRARVIPVPSWLVPLFVELAREVRSAFIFPDERGGQQKKWVAFHRIMKTALARAGLVEGFDHRCVSRGARKGCGHVERRADKARVACPGCGAQLWPTPVPLPLSFKDLRSTFGTWAYAQTGNIRFVQEVLGHADVRVTEERYSHVLEENLLHLADQVNFGPPPGVEGGLSSVSQLQVTRGQPRGNPGRGARVHPPTFRGREDMRATPSNGGERLFLPPEPKAAGSTPASRADGTRRNSSEKSRGVRRETRPPRLPHQTVAGLPHGPCSAVAPVPG
ncbi:phage integrase [Cystobacter fuscus]|uniref:Phage integrase n=1 Tax=Cystobacter fuscus TaxID=43 RepID=A0A250JB35_9BACT|nr:site-specific integrase [Cystobacter fuscus]ATB41119.1 phage integrase [Cystobacter fuscus]